MRLHRTCIFVQWRQRYYSLTFLVWQMHTIQMFKTAEPPASLHHILHNTYLCCFKASSSVFFPPCIDSVSFYLVYITHKMNTNLTWIYQVNLHLVKCMWYLQCVLVRRSALYLC